jgi:hypothetical protein
LTDDADAPNLTHRLEQAYFGQDAITLIDG